MTAQEIYDYIRKNVPLTRTNGVRAWSEWLDYKEENYAALFDASLIAKDFTIEIKKEQKKYRVKCTIVKI